MPFTNWFVALSVFQLMLKCRLATDTGRDVLLADALHDINRIATA